MRPSPSSSRGSCSEPFSPNSHKNALQALVAAVAIGGVACGSEARQVPVESPVTAASEVKKPIPSATKLDLSSFSFNPDLLAPSAIVVEPVIVESETAGKAWPNTPANCVYTGVVLDHDQTNVPHRVLLENTCYQERQGLQNVFAGQHLWIDGNSQGRFEIPFEYSHLEERGDSLVFVVEAGKRRAEEPLVPGINPNTTTFAPALNKYQIDPIVTQ